MNNEGDRYYAWNFTNLYYGGKKTIEFRRGPGAEDDKGCISWIELAVSFVQDGKKNLMLKKYMAAGDECI